uniref:Uncharacterized protein n=1 Tax=Populus trichocarpa TaxID=3694 RepID=A0A2K2AKJ3_POPTR
MKRTHLNANSAIRGGSTWYDFSSNLLFMSQHDCILENIFSLYAIYISGTRGARRRKYPNLVSKLFCLV